MKLKIMEVEPTDSVIDTVSLAKLMVQNKIRDIEESIASIDKTEEEVEALMDKLPENQRKNHQDFLKEIEKEGLWKREELRRFKSILRRFESTERMDTQKQIPNPWTALLSLSDSVELLATRARRFA
jgi:dsDNA-specific endonuclease/ATPase MutS2